jgi:hypothetical protein
MREHVFGVLRELCRSVGLLYAMAILEGVLLAVSLIGLLVVDPNSAGFVMWLLNALALLVLFPFTAGVVIYCFRY